jgi:sulfotransferase
MQQLHYCLGLPRTCSSVIMNILNENPRFFTTGTCPLPYLVNACRDISTQVSEFIALDKDVLNEAYLNFLRQGFRGWFESMTDKPVVMSKSRVWAEYLSHTFALNPNSKYLYIVRDLRDIICSFESLLHKYPNITIGDTQMPFQHNTFEKRMELYCTDGMANLGRPLHMLPHVMEVAQRHPENFFFLRHEDFNENPRGTFQLIYQWLGEEYFEHDFENIPKPDYYEHDTVYRSMVTHKTGTKLQKLEPRWPKMMTPEQSHLVIQNNLSYYQQFYPEFV